MTMPKQWYSGTGMHTRESGVMPVASPTKKPLLIRLWCDSVAPLGRPVVPLVNWMLTAERGSIAAATCSSRRRAPSSARREISSNGVQPIDRTEV